MSERICVRVVPNAPKTVCAGAYGSGVKIKIAAQPTDGRANAELVRFLADFFDIRKSDVSIVSGTASHSKTVQIENVVGCLAKLVNSK